jgi:hypothetical protein
LNIHGKFPNAVWHVDAEVVFFDIPTYLFLEASFQQNLIERCDVRAMKDGAVEFSVLSHYSLNGGDSDVPILVAEPRLPRP